MFLLNTLFLVSPNFAAIQQYKANIGSSNRYQISVCLIGANNFGKDITKKQKKQNQKYKNKKSKLAIFKKILLLVCLSFLVQLLH